MLVVLSNGFGSEELRWGLACPSIGQRRTWLPLTRARRKNYPHKRDNS
jgi:hypothetical protein